MRKSNKLIKLLILIGLISLIIFFCFLCTGAKNNKTSIGEYGFKGEGTYDYPYEIATWEDLVKFRDLVNSGIRFDFTYFIQTNDIDLSNVENWTPIGEYGSEKYFYGYYDGGGHTISNITCVNESGRVGFFGVLGGEVRNLGIDSGKFSGTHAGSIACQGSIDAVIFNCFNNATVCGTIRAGGIVDNYNGRVLFCINMGDVESDGVIGGISSWNAQINYCYSTSYNPVSTDFLGQIKNSYKVDKSDLNLIFLQDMYDSLMRWDSGSVDTENVTKITIQNSKMTFISRTFEVGDFRIEKNKMLFVLFLICFLVVVFLDFCINVETKGTPKHEKG